MSMTRIMFCMIAVLMLTSLTAYAAPKGEGRYVVKPSFAQILDYPFFENYDSVVQEARFLAANCGNKAEQELDNCINQVLKAYNEKTNFIWNRDKCPEDKDELSPYNALLLAYEDCGKDTSVLPCECGSVEPAGLKDFTIKIEQPTEDTTITLFNKDDIVASKLIDNSRISSYELGTTVADMAKLPFEIKKDTCPDGNYCTADKKIELTKIGDRIAFVKQKNSKKLPPLPKCNQPNIFIDVVPFSNKDYESEDKSTLLIGQSLKEKFSNNKINVELSFAQDTTSDPEIRKLVALSALLNSKAYITLAISENIQEDFQIDYNARGDSLAYLIKGKINKTFAERNYEFILLKDDFLSLTTTNYFMTESAVLTKPIPILILTLNKKLVDKYDEKYLSALSDSIGEAINYYFLNAETTSHRFKFCVQSKEKFYSYNSVTKAIEEKPLEFKFALTIGKKYAFPANLGEEAAKQRIRDIAKELNLPDDLTELGLAIAYLESNFEHFDENGGVKVSPTLDHGMMQINENAHPDCFDNSDSSAGICSNQFCSGKTALDMDCNIAAGLMLLKDNYLGKDELGRDKCYTLSCCGQTSCAQERQYCGILYTARAYNGLACCPSQADPLDCGGYVARIKEILGV